MIAALTVALVAAAPGPVGSRAQLASQLGPGRVEVHFDARGRVSLGRGALGSMGGDAVAFVRERAAPLGLRPGEGLRVERQDRTAEGTRHVRIGRSLGGIPVALDEIRVHALPDGTAYAMESETSPLDDFVYRPPSFPPTEAVRRASGGYQGAWAEPPSSTLVVVGARLDGVKGTHLAYRVRLAYPVQPGQVPRQEEVYVDAHSGDLLGRLSLVMTATPTTIRAIDLDGQAVTLNASQDTSGIALLDAATVSGVTTALVDGSNGNAVYVASGNPATLDDRHAVSAAATVARALAFDKATFGWDRWDFNQFPSAPGGTLIAIPHQGVNLANAYWLVVTGNSGRKYGSMNFGDGDGTTFGPLERCLDVAAHEIGHGIVGGSANLVYHNQSGALNEHFADVFGWLAEPGDTRIGERCLLAAGGRGLRDMCSPGDPAGVIAPQPTSMAEYRDLPDTSEGDNGGVHVNSGIPNRAACLFQRATSFDALGKVWFRALTMHLGPTSDFRAMVEATMTSCQELGLGSCAALGDAWAQVGLAPAASGTTCPPHSTSQASQCVCDAGYHVNSASTGCEPDAAVTCPPHAHAVGGECYCDAGYTPDPAGATCVPLNTGGACGPNAHVEGTQCVCDPCYQRATYEATTCTPIAGCAVCTDPLTTSDGRGGCACVPGTERTAAGCAPVAGQCGDESYAGRCVGDVLVYCNDTGTPIRIEAVDCSKNATRTACALGDNGYDCLEPTSSCGPVPLTGACAGSTARYCSSGTIESVDCGEYPCRAFTYRGVPVNFCYPCGPHATWHDAASGDGACTCDDGYSPSLDRTACLASGGGGGSGGSAGGGKSGGCSSGGPAASLPLLALAVALALVRVRRRRP